MKKSHKYIIGILASIVIIISLNIFEDYEKEIPPKYPKLSSKQEKVLKAKYEISDSDSIKCNSSMYVENKTYDYYIASIRNDIDDLRWQGNLNVTDNKLFYIIYIITYIDNHQYAIKVKAPISNFIFP